MSKDHPATMRPPVTALVGNPNSGKTTLFNALTGLSQRVGNWPGVTVEKVIGQCAVADQRYPVCDLPGICSLQGDETAGIDERLTWQCLQNNQVDRLIHVVDACHLARHLYLTLQLLELGLPMLVVLTMNDRLSTYDIDTKRLAKQLGVPVIAVSAYKQQGLAPLKQWLAADDHPIPRPKVNYPPEVVAALASLETTQQPQGRVESADQASMRRRHYLDWLSCGQVDDTAGTKAQVCFNEIQVNHPAIASQIAQTRYQSARDLFSDCVLPFRRSHTAFARRFDRLVLNRWLGLPMFLLIMYALFFAAVNVGGIFQDSFDIVSEGLFVSLPQVVLNHLGAPLWLISLISQGIGKGLNTLLTFVPVITAMCFFLALLESSGYMVRAAFVVDRLMRLIGLSGRAFVPLLLGFGCNVPAVMATRTLDNEKDRIVTALMTPFMACSARLAVFTAFVSLFFPRGGHNIIFLLYVIGVSVAVLTAFLLKGSLGRQRLAPLMMELPDYHRPSLPSLCHQSWSKLRHFIRRSGLVIIPFCALFGVLNMLHIGADGLRWSEGGHDSVIASMARWLTPVLHPMGITNDNWPATVGLLAGTVAKEVVVGSLNTLYSGGQAFSAVSQASFSLLATLKLGLQSIGQHLLQLPQLLLHPFSAYQPSDTFDQQTALGLRAHFHNSHAAISYLLFTLLYVPCISTVASLAQEIGQFWTRFSVVWSTVVAYLVAVLFYQLSTANWGWALWLSGLVLVSTALLIRYAIDKQWVVFNQLAWQPSASGATNGGCSGGCSGCGEPVAATETRLAFAGSIAASALLRKNREVAHPLRSSDG